jgi:putative chitinase
MAFQFTYEILHEIAPHGSPDVQKSLIDPLNKWLPQYGIDTQLRIEHFIGQAAEETDSFRTLTEYASGKAYEGRRDLGNVNPGDGVKFKGRGIFQITGRANYQTYGQKIGVDLVTTPELAATADIAVRTACEYWKSHNLNALADNDDYVGITKRINGGTNGLAMRKQFILNADDAIGDFFPDQDGTQIGG